MRTCSVLTWLQSLYRRMNHEVYKKKNAWACLWVAVSPLFPFYFQNGFPRQGPLGFAAQRCLMSDALLYWMTLNTFLFLINVFITLAPSSVSIGLAAIHSFYWLFTDLAKLRFFYSSILLCVCVRVCVDGWAGGCVCVCTLTLCSLFQESWPVSRTSYYCHSRNNGSTCCHQR